MVGEKKRYIKGFILFIIIVVVIILVFLYRPSIVYGSLISGTLGMLGFGFAMLIARIIMSRMSPWNKADLDELKREDSVLIGGVGFIQATIIIFLSEMFKSLVVSLIIKGNIVLFTVLFYIFRAYGHIKDNSRWRWRSIQVLMIAICFEIPLIIWVFLYGYMDIQIQGIEVAQYVGLSIFLFGVALYEIVKELFYLRYDLS